MRIWVAALLLVAGCGTRNSGIPENNGQWFREAVDTGFAFTHSNGATGQFLMTEIMGSGVALFDFDNDGDLDIFCVQSVGESKLFRNESIPGEKLRFRDVTAQSGIAFQGYGMGAATGDFDNDGWMDLLVTGYDRRSLYRNEGSGKFAEVTFPQPPGVWSTSASFFDYDRDGLLDLVILSYVNFTEAGNKVCHAPSGERDYCTPKAYSPVSARLYHNEGSGRFTDVTEKAGLNRALGPGLGVAAADLNDDQWPDLFVANDTVQNHVWINQRNGTFLERGLEAGAAFSEDGLPKAGMGVAVGDADSDGHEDLLVLNLVREGATFFRKTGVGPQGLPMYEDVTRRSGLYVATLPFTGFGAGWVDFDNDSDLDLFTANGAVTLREEQRGQPMPFREKNLLMRNDGKGRFTDATIEASKVFELFEVSRGAAFGDLDNDGDIDIVMTNNGGPARILENTAPARRWIGVELTGSGRSNRDGIGARVTLVDRAGGSQIRRVHTDSSYCSASDKRVHFGLGERGEPARIEILWPDGLRQKVEPVEPGRFSARHPPVRVSEMGCELPEVFASRTRPPVQFPWQVKCDSIFHIGFLFVRRRASLGERLHRGRRENRWRGWFLYG